MATSWANSLKLVNASSIEKIKKWVNSNKVKFDTPILIAEHPSDGWVAYTEKGIDLGDPKGDKTVRSLYCITDFSKCKVVLKVPWFETTDHVIYSPKNSVLDELYCFLEVNASTLGGCDLYNSLVDIYQNLDETLEEVKIDE